MVADEQAGLHRDDDRQLPDGQAEPGPDSGRHEAITREWWDGRRHRFDQCVSQLVLEEAGKGDAEAAAKRLEALVGLRVLPVTTDALDLAKSLVGKNSLPRVATLDALHLALAVVHEADILLTWNCTHLANAVILGAIGRLVRSLGYEMPIVCTPDELMGEEGQGHD